MTTKALNKAQAERLVARISESAGTTVNLIVEAFHGRAHLALGYRNWQAFAAAELPQDAYTPEDREVALVDLTEAGLSTRSAVAALGVNHGTVTAPVVPRRPKRSRETSAAKGAQIQAQVERYREVMAKHPTWTPGAVKEHLGIEHPKTVSRLRIWAQAPGEAQQYLFSGQITPAVAEAVLANPYASDESKMVVLRKIVTGVIPSPGTPRTREIMALIPQIQPYPDLLLRWSSPELAMTVDELREELIDLKNSRVVTKQQRAQQAAETRMLTESGFNAMAWLDEMAENLDLVEQMWPVLSANPWVRAKLVKKLAENGDRLLRLAERGGQQPASSATEEAPDPLVIRGEIVT